MPLRRPARQGAGYARQVLSTDRAGARTPLAPPRAFKKPLDPAAVNRQIGRILQQNQRAAARFAIALTPDACPAGFRLSVDCKAAFDDWAALSEGAYLLRSNIGDWSDHELWKAYIQLTQAEAAFRIQKDQLNLRPIWHQREDRVQAHILVCFLAFALWKSLEMWQQRAGLGNSPRTLLEEFARIQSHDVVLPTATRGEIRLRCVAQPDAAQAALFDRLGIVLPKRMRLLETTTSRPPPSTPEPATHQNVVPTFRLFG